MPDQVKMLIAERNGVELDYQEEHVYDASNQPFSRVGYTSDNTSDAIGETRTTSGISRFVVPFSNNNVVQSGDYLEYGNGNSSDTTPFIATETSQIVNLSVSNINTVASATLAVEVNGVEETTITITSDDSASVILGTPVDLVQDDQVSVLHKVGNNLKNVTLSVKIKVLA
jgi:hypothetical protein